MSVPRQGKQRRGPGREGLPWFLLRNDVLDFTKKHRWAGRVSESGLEYLTWFALSPEDDFCRDLVNATQPKGWVERAFQSAPDFVLDVLTEVRRLYREQSKTKRFRIWLWMLKHSMHRLPTSYPGEEREVCLLSADEVREHLQRVPGLETVTADDVRNADTMLRKMIREEQARRRRRRSK